MRRNRGISKLQTFSVKLLDLFLQSVNSLQITMDSSLETTTPFWTSENESDQAEMIVRRILFGIRLKFHYLMVASVASIVLFVLSVLILVGLFMFYCNVNARITEYRQSLVKKKLPKMKLKKL